MWWNNGMNWGGMGGIGAGGWVVMTIVMLAFWALVVAGVVALFRNGRATGSGSGAKASDSGRTDNGSADKVLDQRFARGEIDADEYQARRAVLSSTQDR